MDARIDSLLKGAKDADPRGGSGRRGKYINVAGSHVVEIETVKCFVSKQGNKRVNYVVEFRMLETDNEHLDVGEIYVWVHDLSNEYYGIENAKQFTCAVMGLDVESSDENVKDECNNVGEGDIKLTFSDEQPLAGEKVCLETYNTVTKAGKDFTVFKWQPYVPTENA